MNKPSICSFLLVVFSFCFGVFHQAAIASEKLDVLLIDGQNNHDWQETSPKLRKTLERTGRFSVDVLTVRETSDWEQWDGSFSLYDGVLLNYFGGDWPADRMQSFVKFVRNGGGLVVYHAATATFQSSEAFNRMIVLGWRDVDFGARLVLDKYGSVQRVPTGEGPEAGHGSKREYPVTMGNSSHPITKHIPDTWMHARDELYHGLRGPSKKMNVLASGYSPKTKVHEPVLWTVPYGNGNFGKPVKNTFTVTVEDGTLNIEFLNRKNHPLLAAIEIRRINKEK